MIHIYYPSWGIVAKRQIETRESTQCIASCKATTSTEYIHKRERERETQERARENKMRIRGGTRSAIQSSARKPIYFAIAVARLSVIGLAGGDSLDYISLLPRTLLLAQLSFEWIFNIMKTFIMQALYIIKQGPELCAGCQPNL